MARFLESGTRVFGGADGLPDGEVLWGMTTLTLTGGEMFTTVALRPTLTLTGRIVIDAAQGRPSPAMGSIQLTLTPAPPVEGPLAAAYRLNGPPRTSSTAVVQPNGTFAIRGLLPGRYTLGAFIPGSTPASGTGQAVADIVVVAFPRDRSLWWEGSRRLLVSRPDTTGRFVLGNLPPGDYLLSALTDVDEESWRTPEFLARIAPFGVPVSLDEGERKVQDLRAAR
jgi:hypothetical protein